MSDGYAKKYEYKHDDPEAPWNRPKIGNSRKYKNTRKWCKGKVGREHVYKAAVPQKFNYWAYDRHGVLTEYQSRTSWDTCQVCGKKANYTFDMRSEA